MDGMRKTFVSQGGTGWQGADIAILHVTATESVTTSHRRQFPSTSSDTASRREELQRRRNSLLETKTRQMVDRSGCRGHPQPLPQLEQLDASPAL
ncbi:hypothetical protein AB1N83_013166 [Pleurotus pulmonarius]